MDINNVTPCDHYFALVLSLFWLLLKFVSIFKVLNLFSFFQIEYHYFVEFLKIFQKNLVKNFSKSKISDFCQKNFQSP